jgi:hypothetical protein
MEEAKVQALHDTLSKLKRSAGLGVSSHYNFGKIKTTQVNGETVRADGLPNNPLYFPFVREGTYDRSDKGDAARYGDGIDSDSGSDRKKKLKEKKKAEKKAAKLEAKRQAKLEEKRRAKKLAQLNSTASSVTEPDVNSGKDKSKENKKIVGEVSVPPEDEVEKKKSKEAKKKSKDYGLAVEAEGKKKSKKQSKEKKVENKCDGDQPKKKKRKKEKSSK